MKVQISHVMARELSRNIPEITSIESIRYIELSIDSYNMLIARAMDNFPDFIPVKNAMRAIEIVYNDTCFACNRYLTTKQLNRAFLNSDGSYDSFMAQVFMDIEI